MQTETIITRPIMVPRRSSLELLRIICMIFIVAHHFGVHGGYGNMEMSFFNQFVICLLSAGGKLGVNIYVLISGYFLINSKFNIMRIVKTVGLTAFYSATIYLIFSLATPGFEFSFDELLDNVFVVRNSAYWFVTCYVAMVILSPFINKLIYALSEKEHISLILVLLFMQVAFPHSRAYISLSQTAWFVTLYIIASYIRLYPKKQFNDRRITGIASLVLCIVIGAWSATTGLTNIVCLLGAISLFMFFNSLNIKTNRFINLISKTTFGIYLIHDNDFVRVFIWQKLFNCPFHAGQKTFWLFSAVAVIVVFVACSLIELIRMLITKLIIKLYNKSKQNKKATV